MKIQKLPSNIASRIAAGEVIERPLSVVKELLENSVDSGASRIEILISNGGLRSIVVEDDGDGIAFEELPLATERHATSKINSIEDLSAIKTLGYRGEALSSIATVSRLDIRSRVDDEDGGWLLIEGGILKKHIQQNCKKGTRIQVSDLFFNLPARRKFLKTPSGEFRRISKIVHDYGIAYPEISFVLKHDGKKTYSSPGALDRTELLKNIWGKEPDILTSVCERGVYRTQVWWQRQNSKRQNITSFVNGRRIENSAIKAAISAGEAHSGGNWLVYIDVPPEEVDVNIHPAKTEILFRHGDDLFKSVRDSVMGLESETVQMPSLLNYNAPITNERVLKSDETLDSRRDRISFTRPTFPSREDINTKGDFCRVSEPIFLSEPEDVELESPLELKRVSEPLLLQEEGEDKQKIERSNIRYLGQLKSGYLLFEDEQLVIMDPHAAHERVNFEDIKRRALEGRVVQKLSIEMDLAPTLTDDVWGKREDLEKFGFEFQEEGGVLKLSGYPDSLGSYGINPMDALRVAAHALREEGEDVMWLKWATLACKASVKLTTSLSAEEALQLWSDLGACEMPSVCPHGRPTMLKFGKSKLDSHFGRC